MPAPGEAADLARVAAAVRDSAIAVDEIALRRPTLDDAFLALTGRTASADTAASAAGDGDGDGDGKQAPADETMQGAAA